MQPATSCSVFLSAIVRVTGFVRKRMSKTCGSVFCSYLLKQLSLYGQDLSQNLVVWGCS